MKIILTNNHLLQFGGTEQWVLTMARELHRRGHQVVVYTKHKGVVSRILSGFCHVVNKVPKQTYDLALINHNTCMDVKANRKIFTSHSPFIPIEAPVIGADVYVAVSENVAYRHALQHIIKNPIDTELYKPRRPIAETPEEILAITNVPPPISHWSPSRTEETMPELMNKADLVVTIGRGVLEAMSCARNVIVWDDRPTLGRVADGYLDHQYLHGNVGGKYHLKDINWEEELAKYKQEDGDKNREYILKHHDVRLIVDQYLAL